MLNFEFSSNCIQAEDCGQQMDPIPKEVQNRHAQNVSCWEIYNYEVYSK